MRHLLSRAGAGGERCPSRFAGLGLDLGLAYVIGTTIFEFDPGEARHCMNVCTAFESRRRLPVDCMVWTLTKAAENLRDDLQQK
jgi:hypothetical protein